MFLLLAVAGALSASASGESKSASVTVQISSMKFNPMEMHAKSGDKITWVNDDLVPHTVTALDKAFASGPILPGKSWVYKAKKAGSHAYKCEFHPTMSGQLVIE